MMNYYLLGKSGLRVAPFALGTMTFGTEWGWGSPEDTARKIFNLYVDTGGNFIDTADLYTNGTSEEMVGKFTSERRLRDNLVIATKYTFNLQPGNPNSGGNGRKNLYRAIEGSLKRLKTDYIDLLWVHAWDTLTPIDEVVHALNSLVESGTIRYIGLSDFPAWVVSRAHTLADLRGWEKISAIQMEYNLTDRSIENEYVPMVQTLGMGTCVWSPLAGGFLSGKYDKNKLSESQGRLGYTSVQSHPVAGLVLKNPRNWEIVEVLKSVAHEMDKSPAQVALNWITERPGITSTIIGATKIDQLKSNLQSLDFTIPKNLSEKLEQISARGKMTPYIFYDAAMQQNFTGGTNVIKEPVWFE
jgi:aryl-alcohol dehydrogenase-like predicted oxidoreductase